MSRSTVSTAGREWLGTVLIAATVAASGCASGGGGPSSGVPDRAAPSVEAGGTGGAAREERGDASRQVLVVLPPAPPDHWAEVTSHLATVHGMTPIAAWEMKSLRELCVVYEAPPYATPEELAERLTRNPRVLLAQPNQSFRVQGEAVLEGAAESDPYLELQHAARTLRLAAAHRLATGRGVTVALVDTGVDVDHPDLRGRIAGVGSFVTQGEKTFTSDTHGTAIAGVVAAAAGNGKGIVGVAPQARILALKACWHEPPGSRRALCTSYTLAQALDFAIGADARVLTLSLTGPDDALLARLLERALETGMVVVAAVDVDLADGGFPARLAGVVAPWPAPPEEGAAPPAEGDAGPADALRAPAEEILTTTPRGAYDFFSGSSFAAAHAAGVAALVLELRPGATSAEVEALLDRTARLADRNPSLDPGAGRAGGPRTPGDPEPPAPPARALRLLDAAAALGDAAAAHGDAAERGRDGPAPNPARRPNPSREAPDAHAPPASPAGASGIQASCGRLSSPRRSAMIPARATSAQRAPSSTG